MKGIEELNEMISISDEPVLLKDVEFDYAGDEVVLDVSISREELSGVDNMPPAWYEKLLNVEGRPVLVIDKINSVDEREQAKFIDIIKHKKVGEYKLPENTIILITCYSSLNNKVNESILTLVSHM